LGQPVDPIFVSQAVQEDCLEQVDALWYMGRCGPWLVLRASKGANQVAGTWSCHSDVRGNWKRARGRGDATAKAEIEETRKEGEPITAYTASTCTQLSSRTAWPLKIGSIGCPETSVTNYKLRSLNIPEERWPRLFTCHPNSALYCGHLKFLLHETDVQNKWIPLNW
jgi:hypothetical protein